MFSQEIVTQIAASATAAGLEQAALLAVAEVESGGRAFAIVGGRPEPVIRFEGHYFDRRLSGGKRAAARAQGLASPQAGRIKNPATQSARWRMLERAAEIDADAAYESVSWGLGQVMGAHWAWLGYASVGALADEARAGASGQARLMARYIEKAGLAGALLSHDWKTFARGYNGPGYAKNGYHLKIAVAYRRYAGVRTAGIDRSSAKPSLRQGCVGEAVSALQAALGRLGYALTVDGVFGPATRQAVLRFQGDRGLAVDGIAGPQTMAALQQAITAIGKPGDAP